MGDLAAIAPARMPILFGLRLGSGNAIADVCGASAPSLHGLAADLARAAGDQAPGELRLLSIDGRLGHSAGIGLDAKFNEDLRAVVKQQLGRGRLGPLFHGVPGIALAAITRTVPRLVREPRLGRARLIE